jgi:acetyl-CoA carboxylase biotin carboxyl carrier protein
MNNKELQELIRLIDKLEIAEFELKQGDFELAVRSKKFIEAKMASKNVVVQAPAVMASAPVSAAPQASAPAVSAPAQAPAASPAAAEKDSTAGLIEIKSPMVGTFYRSASPDKPAYVQIGDEIRPGSPLCIIEAMKLFNEIESEVSGRIVKILVDDSKPVEYDQPLFLVEPK